MQIYFYFVFKSIKYKLNFVLYTVLSCGNYFILFAKSLLTICVVVSAILNSYFIWLLLSAHISCENAFT